MEDIQEELMKLFENSVKESELDMDLNTNNNGYTDKLTVIAYHFFVEGIKNTQQVLLVSDIA